jgi:hypothetical protein
MIVIDDRTSKALTKAAIKFLKNKLDELYLEIEHGDDEHRKWLKDKIEDFKTRLGLNE